MLIRDFINEFEKKYPINLQEKWDNGGIQIGDLSKEISGILICLDITIETIKKAVETGCNFIISHHPILFNPVKQIEKSNFMGRKIIEAIKNGITIYSTHTSIDVNGLNTFIFEKMGFNSCRKLIEFGDFYGYGDLAEVQTTTKCIIEKIKKSLDINHVVFYGDENKNISKIAFQSGEGNDFINDALSLGVDLYISADIKHHFAMDAVEKGLSIIDLGHYYSEKLFIDLIEKYIFEKKLKIKYFKYFNETKYQRKIF